MKHVVSIAMLIFVTALSVVAKQSAAVPMQNLKTVCGVVIRWSHNWAFEPIDSRGFLGTVEYTLITFSNEREFKIKGLMTLTPALGKAHNLVVSKTPDRDGYTVVERIEVVPNGCVK